MINDMNSIDYFMNTAITRNGVNFDPNDNIWLIDDINSNFIFDFNLLKITLENIHNLKKIFVWYLENHSAIHSRNMYNHLKRLLNFLYEGKEKKISQIKDTDLINYRNHLGQSREYYLGVLSSFLKKCFTMYNFLLDKSAYSFFYEVKLKGNIKGGAVLTMSPTEGPYTDLELERIQTAINNSYAKNDIKQEDYILIWMFMIYGSRPIQFAQLKVKDVIVSTQNDSSIEVIINIPRAKNRMKARSEFKKRIIPNSLSGIIKDYRDIKKQQFVPYLKDTEEAPLFAHKIKESTSSQKDYNLKYHSNSNDIRERLNIVFNKLNLISERTGEKMNISAVRFRRTIGTRAAQEGHGELIIAEILDHTDIQNAGIYVQSTPEIIERIDNAIALQMAPIAQAFAGKLIKDKTSALRANDPEAGIVDPSIDHSCKEMGKCGSFGFCGLMAPIACYTCSSFQAWADGPHEAVLSKLLNDRDRLMKITDYRIASVNDKTILAVAQVVLACKAIKDEDSTKVSQ